MSERAIRLRGHQLAAQKRRSPAQLFALRAEISSGQYGGIAVASFAFVLAAWCALSFSGLVSAYILPTPTAVVGSFFRLLGESLGADMGMSLYRVWMGFLVAAALAIPLGLVIGLSKPVEAFVEPMMGFVRYTPAAAFIPLVMVWLGIGETAKIAIIFIGTFFQMVLVVADVARAVPADLINVSLTLGAKPRQVLGHVLLPATLPGLLDACRVMVGWAWTYLVVAELVAANSGLGFRIMKAQRFLNTSDVFVGILVIGILGLATDLAFRALAARLVPWAAVHRAA
ncbi:MAG: NitT/TauT family transport system permease protein [Chloroflexota bacterium]|nr:NitT/TauT family transport system permease protein [Chloroflexota bacterium]